jgi:translation initiation factor IF-2
MRIYELAKEYDKKSTDFVDIIRGFGINVKSHLSTLDDDRVTEIRNKLDAKQAVIDLENDLLERSLGVKEPLEDSGRDDENTDNELSFGQQAFAKAKDFESYDSAKNEIQEVEVEKSTGFFGWLKGLFI